VAESAGHVQSNFAAGALTSELGFGKAIGDFVGERLR